MKSRDLAELFAEALRKRDDVAAGGNSRARIYQYPPYTRALGTRCANHIRRRQGLWPQ